MRGGNAVARILRGLGSAAQVEIHRALNLNLVPPGEQWEDYGGRGLFDELWMGEEVPHG